MTSALWDRTWTPSSVGWEQNAEAGSPKQLCLEVLGRNNVPLCFSQLAGLGTALQPCRLCWESCSSLDGLTVVWGPENLGF